MVSLSGVQLLVGKTAQAAAIPAMVANAQATALQAQLAAFASTAAIPIVGLHWRRQLWPRRQLSLNLW